MAYQFPFQGGLKISAKGKTIGVFAVETGVGWGVIIAEQDPTGWLGRWNSGFKLESEFKAEVEAMGGIVKWLEGLIAKINAALANVFGSAPAPGTAVSVENINLSLAQSFGLIETATGVQFFKR